MSIIPTVRYRLDIVFGGATVWLDATAWAFHADAGIVGFALGIALILAAALASVTHICIPSFIHNTVNRTGRRQESGS
jgi:hypothetical protein